MRLAYLVLHKIEATALVISHSCRQALPFSMANFKLLVAHSEKTAGYNLAMKVRHEDLKRKLAIQQSDNDMSKERADIALDSLRRKLKRAKEETKEAQEALEVAQSSAAAAEEASPALVALLEKNAQDEAEQIAQDEAMANVLAAAPSSPLKKKRSFFDSESDDDECKQIKLRRSNAHLESIGTFEDVNLDASVLSQSAKKKKQGTIVN